MSHYFFTSESVTEGHPDKICDQISDAVLDAILEQDPMGRVACETTVSTGLVHIMGEISTSCYVDIPKITRQVIRDIGYDRAKYGFDCDTCGIITNIDEQSGDIAMGVDKALENKTGEYDQLQNGAGDQGMMFGYACDETPELMPLAISLAHKLAKRLTAVRKSGELSYLRPDGKTQVTIEYDENRRPVRVDTVVISTQHAPEAELEQIRRDMIERVIKPTIAPELLDDSTRYLINPTGRFVVGGPEGDSGLTGQAVIELKGDTVMLSREGEASMRLILKQGCKYVSTYSTPFGRLDMEALPTRVMYAMGEAEGRIELEYHMHVQNQYVGLNRVSVQFHHTA